MEQNLERCTWIKGCVFDSSDAGVPRGCQLDRNCQIGLAVGPERAEGSLNAFGINLYLRTLGVAGMEKHEAVLKRPFSSGPGPQYCLIVSKP
jgi:predicted metal-binding protein